MANKWPARELNQRITDILADGVVTNEELDDLLVVVENIAGRGFSATGDANEGTAFQVCTQCLDGFCLEGSVLCFTGKFVAGKRSAVEKEAKAGGALISSSVSKELDALIVGTLASRDWRFSSYGRKVEAALELQEKGTPIKIISERDYRGFLI